MSDAPKVGQDDGSENRPDAAYLMRLGRAFVVKNRPDMLESFDHVLVGLESPPTTPPPLAGEGGEEIEGVIACLVDDAQQLRGTFGEDSEIAANMERAAQLLELRAPALAPSQGTAVTDAQYEVRKGSNGEWAIYARAFNVRIATFAQNTTADREVIAAALRTHQKVAAAGDET